MSSVRPAAPADAAEVVRLRRLMFEAMGIGTDDEAWETRATDCFARRLGGPDLAGFVVDAPHGGGLAASGLVELLPRLPSPFNPTGLSAYVSTISTDPRWRRRGFARGILRALLEECERRGAGRVELHATADGMALYRAHGFVERGTGVEMRWTGR